MGEDMLLSVAIIKKKRPEFNVIENLMIEKLNEINNLKEFDNFADQIGFSDLPLKNSLKEIKKLAKETIHSFIRMLRDVPRDVAKIEFKGYDMWCSGGMSWGDSPSNSFDVTNAFYTLPLKIIKAGGFE